MIPTLQVRKKVTDLKKTSLIFSQPLLTFPILLPDLYDCSNSDPRKSQEYGITILNGYFLDCILHSIPQFSFEYMTSRIEDKCFISGQLGLQCLNLRWIYMKEIFEIIIIYNNIL